MGAGTTKGSEAPHLHGRFRIESELARGGMATVFAAFDTAHARSVALKRLEPHAPQRVATLFEREFYVLSSLRHPRIVEVYEFGIDAIGPFYTMELLAGADLRDLAPLPPTAACRYVRDVASSLALLHARRLLHRDVSPRNVRTLPDGGCKLIDFGALTSFGSNDEVVGTPPAIAPEVLAGEPLDQRTDLFSLGALAYFLLTGRHAYPARSVRALPDIWTTPLPAPSALAPQVPKPLDELVLALLSLASLGRPGTAAEVIDRLNAIADLAPEQDARVTRAYFVGTQLIEREHEHEHAARCIARARSQHGGALFLRGESGVGKTRLLQDIALKAQLAGLTVLRAAAAEQHGPLLTVRALVQQALRLAPATAGPIFAPCAGALRALWGDALGASEQTADTSAQLTPEQVLETLPGQLVEGLLQFAQQQAVAIVVDDVDSADARSAALLMALARRAHSHALLVATSSSLAQDADKPAVRNLREASLLLQLRALSHEGTLGVVQAAFGDVPHVRRTAQRLYAATRGNPEHVMQLLQRWVEDGLIRYVDGAFSLPLELPEPALLAADRVAHETLTRCSSEALLVAHLLALQDTPTTIPGCVELAAPLLDRRGALAAVEALIGADLLVQSPHGLRFRHELLRTAALESLPAQTRQRLQAHLGEHLLASCDGSYEAVSCAGLHLLRGGQATRGAELIARAARAALAADQSSGTLARASTALEAALATYRDQGRSPLQQLDLLVPLTICSYEMSPAFAARYGSATLSALVAALGLASDRVLADHAALIQLLRAAPVLPEGEPKSEQTPDALTLLGWLLHCVLSLVAVASAAIDHEAEARYIEPLRPFRALGKTHPATFMYEYCVQVIGLSEDHAAQSHRDWSELLERLPAVRFPPNVEARLQHGALYALGLLECQREDEAALQRLEQLNARHTPRTAMMADQLGFLYHAFRGRIDRAEHYRDRVEAYAVQHGSAWQAEIWATCTSCAVYGLTRDLTGIKRAVQQLERLRQAAPSLLQYWERACGTQALLNHEPERARVLYERALSHSGPRERVGWSAVRGALTATLNALGQHARAKQICEETLALSAADLAYPPMVFTLQTELICALIGLEDFAAADSMLAQLIAHHTPYQNPVILGRLHHVGVELARARADIVGCEHHLESLQRLVVPTRNPALVAQYERLRHANAAHYVNTGAADESTERFTAITVTLAETDRKQRALELLAKQAGVDSAHLFERSWNGDPILLRNLGAVAPSHVLLDRVSAMFQHLPDDDEETAFVPSDQPPPLLESHRLLPLTVLHDAKRLLVGAVALPTLVTMGQQPPLNYALLNDLAIQVFQARERR